MTRKTTGGAVTVIAKSLTGYPNLQHWETKIYQGTHCEAGACPIISKRADGLFSFGDTNSTNTGLLLLDSDNARALFLILRSGIFDADLGLAEKADPSAPPYEKAV